MRRLSGVILAGAMMLLPAFSQGHSTVFAQAAPQKQTFSGDMVLWAFAVIPDKTGDYEQVLAKLKEALMKSERPDAKQQAAGWKVVKNATPNADGTLVYVHVISPVVAGADYSITNTLYEVFKDPAEQKTLYDQYRGSVKGALFLIQGPAVADFSK
jgi:hypothetical protein